MFVIVIRYDSGPPTVLHASGDELRAKMLCGNEAVTYVESTYGTGDSRAVVSMDVVPLLEEWVG